MLPSFLPRRVPTAPPPNYHPQLGRANQPADKNSFTAGCNTSSPCVTASHSIDPLVDRGTQHTARPTRWGRVQLATIDHLVDHRLAQAEQTRRLLDPYKDWFVRHCHVLASSHSTSHSDFRS